jgi:hypothetical protein
MFFQINRVAVLALQCKIGVLKLKNSAENKKDFSEMTVPFAFAKFNKISGCPRPQAFIRWS